MAGLDLVGNLWLQPSVENTFCNAILLVNHRFVTWDPSGSSDGQGNRGQTWEAKSR